MNVRLFFLYVVIVVLKQILVFIFNGFEEMFITENILRYCR